MTPLHRLLVPVDGSETSNCAVDFSIGLAKYAAADIVFCHSVQRAGANLGATRQFHEDQSQAYLGDALGRARAAGVDAISRVAFGPPVAAIVETLFEYSADAVVMGTHGRGAAHRSYLGSTAEGVLRRADVPVFVVPAGAHNRHTDGSAFDCIEVAFDASGPAQAALEMAFDLAAPGTTNVLISHVLDIQQRYRVGASSSPQPLGSIDGREAARTSIVEAAERAHAIGIAAKGVLLDGSPSRRVLQLARSLGADLIAIGSCGCPERERFLHDGVAEQVLRRASMPVLVVPVSVAHAPAAPLAQLAR
jgi:nucleotide-binding universal stress UspA family protein